MDIFLISKSIPTALGRSGSPSFLFLQFTYLVGQTGTLDFSFGFWHSHLKLFNITEWTHLVTLLQDFIVPLFSAVTANVSLRQDALQSIQWIVSQESRDWVSNICWLCPRLLSLAAGRNCIELTCHNSMGTVFHQTQLELHPIMMKVTPYPEQGPLRPDTDTDTGSLLNPNICSSLNIFT